MPKPEEEEPECEPECRRGYECVDGECERVRCGRGEYYHRRSRACREDPCYRHRCARDERCRRRSGSAVCVKKPTPTPGPGPGPTPPRDKCAGVSCPGGQECDSATGRCRPAAPVTGRILNCWPEGAKTLCLVNKGSQQGITRGMHGRGGGRTFRVIAVYPYQCRVSTPKTGETPTGRITVQP